MSKDTRTPEEVQAANINHVLENGPGLSYAIRLYVVARDPEEGKILLGGLGGMGVGQMWQTEGDDCKDYPGYSDAPIRSSVGGFGA